jgi:hypothetical protein
MSTSDVRERGKEYVVVVTTYPTTYGCNSGERWTDAEFIRGSDIDVYGSDGKCEDPDEPGFNEYKDAVVFAREMLDEECAFGDHSSIYNEDAEPPFDSADFENYDNDSEVLIAIMTKTDFAVMLQYNMQTMGLIDAQGNAIERPTR